MAGLVSKFVRVQTQSRELNQAQENIATTFRDLVAQLNSELGLAASSATSTAGSLESRVAALEAALVADYWDDLQVPGTLGTGASSMTTEAYRDTSWQGAFFRHSLNTSVSFGYQMPHAWNSTTAVRPHLHLIAMADPASPQVVRFTGQAAWVKFGAALPLVASWSTFSVDWQVKAGDAFVHRLLPLGEYAPPSGATGSAVFCLWVQRNGTSSADTYTTGKSGGTASANVMLLSADLHYRRNKLGSVAEIPTVG